VEAHNAGEDELTVRYLTGGYGTVESTLAHVAALARNAAEGRGKRGFGVWLGGRLAGYVDCDPDNDDGLEPDDVNLSYAVHPWARGRGVASAAVAMLCDYVRGNQIGSRAAIRVQAENAASVRVAEKCGFTFVREFVSGTDTHDDSPVTFRLYLRVL
jgi:RimJ/RimL family protein N-acetyltransferase